MFDIGFSELFMIAVVALVVLGPERLPKAARFAGLWVRRARAQWYSVKTELERELASEELQRTVRDTRQVAADIDTDMRAAETEARREFDTMQAQIQHSATDDRVDNTALIERDNNAIIATGGAIKTSDDSADDERTLDESGDVRR